MGTVTESRDGGDGATTLGPFVDEELLEEQATSPTPKKVTASTAPTRCQVFICVTFFGGAETADYCRTFEAFAAAIK
ncbi:unannotated protein [freshwater metagenome]|uniref:Unannotated protein n=1 Tax=freshwater metagenome TaxID=449393 RepID=A0A6J6JTG1_9ZZZZ